MDPLLVTNSTSAVSTNALGEATDIRGLKPAIEMGGGWWWLWALIAVITALIAAWYFWKRKKTPAPVLAAPTIPPHQKARARLEQALRLLDQPKEFCGEVSGALRVYLEEQFDLRAPERTTEEFLAELQTSSVLSPEQKELLAEFLEQCDLVKFARADRTETELRDLYEAALRLISETEPSPLTETVAASGETHAV